MKPELIHILDQSVCLTRRQMKDYLAGTMLPEEQHAAEIHLSSCSLCRMAMEGFEAHTEEALAAISSLNSGFLKEHYDAVTPQIHLNSVAPAMAASPQRSSKGRTQPIWRNLGIAASVLLVVGMWWYLQTGKNRPNNAESHTALAEKIKVSQPAGTSSGLQSADNLLSTEKNVNSPVPKAGPGILNTPADSIKKNIEAISNKTSVGLSVSRNNLPPVLVPGVKTERTDSLLAYNKTNDVVALSTPVYQMRQGSGLSVAGGRSSENIVKVDGVQMDTQTLHYSSSPSAPPASGAIEHKEITPAAKSKAKASDAAVDPMDKGDALADKGNYTAAAGQYKKEMNDESNTARRRHQAGISAARAYIAAGQKAKAIAILQSIIKEGGSQKRVAKRMLRDLEGN